MRYFNGLQLRQVCAEVQYGKVRVRFVIMQPSILEENITILHSLLGCRFQPT